MPNAVLHDSADLVVTVVGTGPAVLLPVDLALVDGPTAEQLRAWGAEPNLGHALVTSLAENGFRVIAADYEGHLALRPKPGTLTAENVATDLLAIADAAGATSFAYYGYSWLAMAGLQLAIRTDRLTALVMGGFSPMGGPYGPMLWVTATAHRMAVENQDKTPSQGGGEAGDWDAVEVTQTPDQTQQYVTLYESLKTFDEINALPNLRMPRLAFAGANDSITYGPKWDNARVEIAEALATHREELTRQGWAVELIDGTDHMSAMQSSVVLPLIIPWLKTNLK
jgi:pimeloyl-ACP methyl ester carboxylesterase